MKKTIFQALKPLVGLPLRDLNRSSSMLSLHFGTPRTVPGDADTSQPLLEWTVQVQCPWRISQAARIVLAYRDFFYSDVPLKNLAVMSKSHSNTLLETLCAEFHATPPRVRSVDTDDTGGFSVQLSSDYRVEVFPAESMESGKHWRIFEPGVQGKSFVFPPSEN